MSDEKQTVELWSFGPDGWCGLILPCESGTVWTNQAAGIACAHPSVEGVYLPMAHRLDHPESFENVGAFRDEYDRAKVAAFLETNGLWFLEPMDGEKLEPMMEAWLRVRIKNFEDGDLYHSQCPTHLHPFQGREVVLTWQNSD